VAYLVKCSLCGREVSNEARACPGCGHDVAQELRQKMYKQKEKWEEQGLCCECGNAKFIIKREETYDPIYRAYRGGYKEHPVCEACGWKDPSNYLGVSGSGQSYVGGKGLSEYKSRKLRRV